MELALELAREASREGEVPVGAVIVRDGSMIAAAANTTFATFTYYSLSNFGTGHF